MIMYRPKSCIYKVTSKKKNIIVWYKDLSCENKKYIAVIHKFHKLILKFLILMNHINLIIINYIIYTNLYS